MSVCSISPGYAQYTPDAKARQERTLAVRPSGRLASGHFANGWKGQGPASKNVDVTAAR